MSMYKVEESRGLIQSFSETGGEKNHDSTTNRYYPGYSKQI